MVRTIDKVYERLQKGMKSDKTGGLYFEFRGKISKLFAKRNVRKNRY